MIKLLYSKVLHSVVAAVVAIASLFGGHAQAPKFGTTIPNVVSLFETSLASSIASTDSSMTLVSGTDAAGNTLSGTYCFLLDGGTAVQEFVCGSAAGTAITSLTRGIDPQNPNTSVTALKFAHRRGADVKVTDYPQLATISRILNGTDTVPNALNYANGVTCSITTNICPKSYVDGVVIAGGVNASSANKGISKLSVDPVSSTNPIAVGDNDTRVPPVNTSTVTSGEVSALVGQSGTAPSSSNKFEDNSDTSATASANKLVRANGSGVIDTSFLPATLVSSQTAVGTITAGQPLVTGYQQSDGGIKVDTNNSANLSGATITQSITVGNNSNRGLLVFIRCLGSSATSAITGATYAGVSMTQADSGTIGNTNGFTQSGYSFYLNAPATGANNLVITQSNAGSPQNFQVTWYSIYNVSQSAQPEVHSVGTSVTTKSITTIANGAAVFGSLMTQGTQPTSITGTATFGGFSTNDTVTFNSAVVLPAATSVSASWTNSAIPFLLSFAPANAPVFGVYPSSSATATYSQFENGYDTFFGFAQGSASFNGSVTVITDGIVTGLTSLTAGKQYFLNDSTGAIGTSAGTHSRKIGISNSTTSLLITNIW